MSPAMSVWLMYATHLSIDMSFKWVSRKWEEFKIETWDNDHMWCKSSVHFVKILVSRVITIVVAWAFLTSETSEAHYLLLSHIFEITQQDTGLEVTFHYISRCSIQCIVADGHREQALGR